MSERAQNLQDTFLNFVRKNKVPLTIFLVNGVKLQGIITWFDNFCLLLRRDGHSQLVYKHAISTIMPGHPIHMFEPARRRREQREVALAGSSCIGPLADGPRRDHYLESSITVFRAFRPAPSGPGEFSPV